MISNLQTQREKIYSALCWTLSERIDQVDWESFSEDDWSRFGNMAIAEGVAPLIHWTFKHEDTSRIEIPTTVKAQLMAAYYNTTAQNQVMFQELERILEALDKAGIPVIVLKGAALATTVYPEIGLRPMGDLDLLVPRDHIEASFFAVEHLGYRNINERPTSTLDWDFEHHLTIIKESEPKVHLELHWNLIAGDADWRSPNLDWFWANKEPIDYQSKKSEKNNHSDQSQVYSLSVQSNILYLCNHQFLQHGDSSRKLLWIYDLDILITQNLDQINWEELIDKAIEFKWLQALQFGVLRSRKLFATPIPDYLIKSHFETKPSGKGSERRWINKTSTKAAHDLHRFSALNTNNDRIRFAISIIFPKPDYMKWRYKFNPEWIWPAAYPYRWFRILHELMNTLN